MDLACDNLGEVVVLEKVIAEKRWQLRHLYPSFPSCLILSLLDSD